jgi:hypothetical protein
MASGARCFHARLERTCEAKEGEDEVTDYYLCVYSKQDGDESIKALAGPFRNPYAVGELVSVQDEPKYYRCYSRYALSKVGPYPRNKKGDSQLVQDVAESGKYKNTIVACKHCGGFMHYRLYHGWKHDMDLSTDGASFLPNGDICGKPEPADK